MSHAIKHLTYHCSVSEKAILKEINQFAYDPQETSGYHGNLKFHKDPVYKNRAEAVGRSREMEGEMDVKYEVSLSDGFGEPNVIMVNTALGGFTRAIEMALDSHYDDEDEVVEIRCRKIKGSEVFHERSNA